MRSVYKEAVMAASLSKCGSRRVKKGGDVSKLSTMLKSSLAADIKARRAASDPTGGMQSVST